MKRIWYLKEGIGTRTKAIKLLIYEKNGRLSGKLDLSAFNKEGLILCFRNKGGEEIRLLGQEELSEEKVKLLQEEKKEWELSATEGETTFFSQGFEKTIGSKQTESPEKEEEVREGTDVEAAEDPDEWDEDQELVNVPEGKRVIQLTTLEEEMLFRDYVHNSFLLHGYYNYGHVILDETGQEPRLGVPGNYYEREQLVAQMFGFPDFEAAQDVEKVTNGTFGYFYTRG